MTGRVICSVLIAAVIATICFFSSGFTVKFAKDVTDRTEKVYYNSETAEKDVQELRENWEKYSDLAALYMEHEELEKVTVLIERLFETDTESQHMFKMDCKEIRLIMEHLKESQMPKLNNIF